MFIIFPFIIRFDFRDKYKQIKTHNFIFQKKKKKTVLQ